MISTIAASAGLGNSYGADLTGLGKPGSLMYSAPAADIGKGPRSDPNLQMPTWTPAPNAYDTRQDANANSAPKYR
jgi:hypothetical protein